MTGVLRMTLLASGATFVFVLALAGSAEGQEKPPEAALTVRITGPRDAFDRKVLVRAAGAQPSADVVLVDESGRYAVTVQPVQGDRACAKAEERRTGLGTEPWCIRLKGVTAGHEFKGKLASAGSVVTLTVTARHSAVLPAVVGALALLVAVVVVFLTTRFLPDQTTKALLRWERRDAAGIAGLGGWVTDAAGRLSPADLLARLRWTKRFGKARVLSARADLRAKLTDPDSPIPDCPLRRGAQHEATRQDVLVSEILTLGGARATSPAEELRDLLERADLALRTFVEISDGLLTRIPADDPNREAAELLREQGTRLAEGYLSEFTIGSFESMLREMLGQIQAFVPDERRRGDGLAAAALVLPWPPQAVEGPPRTAAVAARTAAALGTVVLTTGLLMAAAVLTVLTTQYLPKHTFATASDYIGLAVAAWGSSSAVGIATVLLLMRGPTDWFA